MTRRASYGASYERTWRKNMVRFRRSALWALAGALLASPAWADRVAVLPFASPSELPRPELEEARRWAREAVAQVGHENVTERELTEAEAAVRDGVADTTEECVAAGSAAGADWALTGHLERHEHPAALLPDGAEEPGYTTYRLELEACQVSTGRVESLSREVLPEEGAADVAQMLGLLLRPEGIMDADIPWDRGPRRPPRSAPPPAAEEEGPPPPPLAPPGEPPAPRPVYGGAHPFALGASVGVSGALLRPELGRGPSMAMHFGGVLAYALAEGAPGLELRAVVTGQPIGPRAVEVAAGARYAIAPFGNIPLFVGPELLLGAHVALGAEKATRFLAHGAAFAALAVTDNVQAEVAADLAGAFGGSGTLVLGGGTARALVRF